MGTAGIKIRIQNEAEAEKDEEAVVPRLAGTSRPRPVRRAFLASIHGHAVCILILPQWKDWKRYGPRLC
jgi:hypothetical protein